MTEAETPESGQGSVPEPMPMCPMAEMCQGMMSAPFKGTGLYIAGALLIVLGVAIVIEPRIAVWLLALICAILGIALFLMATFMRRMSAHFERMFADEGSV